MSVVRGLRGAMPALRTSADEADRVAYARDLWPRHHLEVRAGRPANHKPEAIAWPTSTEELAQLVRWASSEQVPLVPFGAGSGVCGGVLPKPNELVVDLKRMGRVRAIDRDAPLVDVEAGCMGVPLERTLARSGFTLGHFPSSILCSTAGGWVATRSAGQCSGAYGKIEDMVVSLECVTGAGEVVRLRRRATRPDLVPLVVGSEGTLAIVASAELRLHPAPAARAFGAWSFPTTEHGWEAMRAMFQAGLRPAVARLYDPFDAMLAKRGGVKSEDGHPRATPGRGGTALRTLLKRPALINELLHSRGAAMALGGAMLVVIFEGAAAGPAQALEAARREVEGGLRGTWEGAAPAERWFEHRYAVSYRQAPVFAQGAFVDTFEVAAPWSALGGLYEAVRRALGEHVFVMAHFSHAYPDGCCIYFSFVGSGRPGRDARGPGWDQACEATYDRAWRAALKAAVAAGGTIAHHHGVGRSKAPRLSDELGGGIEVVRGLMRAMDPGGILNPGNLVGEGRGGAARGWTGVRREAATTYRTALGMVVDRESLLVGVDGGEDWASVEGRLRRDGLTLDVEDGAAPGTVAHWLASGAPGTRDRWLDPVDQTVSGLEATLENGLSLRLRPAPRRAAGPDLTALFVGARGRFGRIDRAWLRVHRADVTRPSTSRVHVDRDPPVSEGEASILDAIEAELGAARR
jgi:alkyldihydroxyacetonephosphate synthase